MSHGTFAEGRSVDAGRPEGTPRPRAGLAQFAPGSAECGVALVAHLSGVPSHETLDRALGALDRLEHRGGEGADVDTGDGAGILLQPPAAPLREGARGPRPPRGRYGVAVCFLPTDDDVREQMQE